MNFSDEALDTILARLLEKYSGSRREYLEVPIEASARHVHLTREAMDVLFGEGSQLQCKKALSQTGEFLSDRRVKIITSGGEISNVAVLGPLRSSVQVELSKTDCRTLGVRAPVRLSGNLEGAADVYIIGDKGIYHARGSAIVAKAHVHLRPQDAVRYGVTDGQKVSIKVQSGRSLTFDDVVIRVKDSFMPAFHVDFDEANACQLDGNSRAFIVKESGSGESVVSAGTSVMPSDFRPTAVNESNIEIPDKTAVEEPVYTEKLVTEEKAIHFLTMINGDQIRFRKGTLLTPSAKDIFARARKEIVLIS